MATAHPDVAIDLPIQRYSKVTALLILASVVFGGIGESYIPGRIIVSGDAAATARNIIEHPLLFRLGFATYLVEGICDIALALMFYYLLRPVSRYLALFTAFLGLFSTALYAVAEAFYFAPTLLLTGGAPYLQAFSPDQLNALAYLSLRFFGRVAGLYLAFYGLATLIRGVLIYRSGYLPRLIGVLFVIGGASFIAATLSTVLAPAYYSNYMLVLMAPAGLSLMIWLLVKGIDAERFRARASLS